MNNTVEDLDNREIGDFTDFKGMMYEPIHFSRTPKDALMSKILIAQMNGKRIPRQKKKWFKTQTKYSLIIFEDMGKYISKCSPQILNFIKQSTWTI